MHGPMNVKFVCAKFCKKKTGLVRKLGQMAFAKVGYTWHIYVSEV